MCCARLKMSSALKKITVCIIGFTLIVFSMPVYAYSNLEEVDDLVGLETGQCILCNEETKMNYTRNKLMTMFNKRENNNFWETKEFGGLHDYMICFWEVSDNHLHNNLDIEIQPDYEEEKSFQSEYLKLFQDFGKKLYFGKTIFEPSTNIEVDDVIEEVNSFSGEISGWEAPITTDINDILEEASLLEGGTSSWEKAYIEDINDIFEEASLMERGTSSWETPVEAAVNDIFEFSDNFCGLYNETTGIDVLEDISLFDE